MTTQPLLLSSVKKSFKIFIATFALIGSGIAMTGCASTGGTGVIDPTTAIGTANNVGMAVFKSAVNQKCQTELQSNQYWRLASVVMTPQKQTEVASNICGCVSEKAPQSVTIVDLTTAAIDPTARNVIVAKAVTNTLQSCMGEIVK